MVEAVSEGLDTLSLYTSLWEEGIFSESDSKTPEEKACLDAHFLSEITLSMKDEEIALLIYQVLAENDLANFEKRLGAGAFGCVFQIQGTGIFEGKSLALKLIPQAPNWWFDSTYTQPRSREGYSFSSYSSQTVELPFESTTSLTNTDWSQETESDFFSSLSTTFIQTSEAAITSTETFTRFSSNLQNKFMGTWSISCVTAEGIFGDGIAIHFPKDSSVIFAYGVLLFDGEKVQYVEEVDPNVHKGNAVVGVVFPAIQSGTLWNRATQLSIEADEVKGYAKSLAQAIHELHGLGYAHRDLHMNNILVVEEENNPYSIKIIDFGLAQKISLDVPSPALAIDWQYFKSILQMLYETSEEEENPILEDLLYGSVLGEDLVFYAQEEALINHPYFV